MAVKRNIVFDTLSGVFILRMVYTHTCMYAEQSSHTILFSLTGMFLMWFFFKGGMLAKEKAKYADVLASSWRKLLKPFIFLTLFAVLFDSILYVLDVVIGGGITLVMS